MRLQRSKDTKPELDLRRALHARGLRFRVHRKVIPGTRRTVDIVFGPALVGVDVHGCYWHGHEHDVVRYGHTRTRNLEYWGPKIARNKERDADTASRLAEAAWTHLVVWECEDIDVAADRIERVVRERRSRRPTSG